MIFMLGVLLAAGGMYCLAIAQSKQTSLLLKEPLSSTQRRFSVAAGTMTLTLCGALAVSTYGIGVGLVTLCAWACVGAWGVALWVTRKRELKTNRRTP